ncbi:MAG: hypothetical protein HYS27_05035 [Deltaproteobacteria bacterium]|nr:hypothetical protein [Deltaproteobacteria bacterium]
MSVALALVLSLAAPAASLDEVESWAELQGALPTDAARRATALLRFADSDRPGLVDRLRAAREARKHKPKRGLAFVVEARLHGVAEARAARTRALHAAAAAFAAVGEHARKQHVLAVSKGDDALLRLVKLVAARERMPSPPPLSAAEEAHKLDVSDALGAWEALSDQRQLAVARALLARLRATSAPPGGPVDVVGATADLALAIANLKGRDGAAVRRDALRVRARLLEAQGDLAGASLASLGADREVVVDPRKPASHQTASRYLKSKASLELCRRARAQGIVCGTAEQRTFGDTLHYDFSKEPLGAFDPEINAEVLADYDTLLQRCIRDAVKAKVPITQTVVELEWAVANDGRVPSYDLRPQRLRTTSYDGCLREAFAVFRYPPYAGEMQHVRLSFEVGGEL